MASGIATSYLRTVFDPELFPATIASTLEAAKMLWGKHGFDTIAFSGMSGAALAFVLSHEMRIPLLCVRKEGDSSHYTSGYNDRFLEGHTSIKKYIIVDDFISSGKTMNYIMDSIANKIPSAKCCAILLYAAFGKEGRPYTRRAGSYSEESIEVVHSRPNDEERDSRSPGI